MAASGSVTRRTAGRRPPLRHAVVPLGAVALVVALAAPAAAAEPANDGVEIATASTSGRVLTWTGSYSCETSMLIAGITVTATDTAGGSGSQTIPVSCLDGSTGQPVRGQAVSGHVDNGLLRSGGDWGDDITVTITLNSALGTALGYDRIVLLDNQVGEVSLDGATPDQSGNLAVTGGFTCPAAGTGTITADESAPFQSPVLATGSLPLSCSAPGAQATFTFPTASTSPRGRATGTVKWFNSEKGFGFITPDSSTADVFVHFSGATGGTPGSLDAEQRVTF